MPKPTVADQGSMLALAAKNVSPADYDELRWVQVQPEVLNHNRLFPYQLLVVRRSENGFVRDNRWTFTLPLPPGSIQIGTVLASDGRPTLTGWVEQHGGIPFKSIQISGTTGVLPMRGSAAVRPTTLAQTLFAGTLQQAQQVVQAGQQVGQALFPVKDSTNLITDEDIVGDIGKTSGYYQFRLLQQFLERYMAMKKTADGKDRFLALAMWKDEQTYLCTPTGSFTLSRTAAAPLEYEYSLSLKGFRRISLDNTPAPEHADQPILHSPDALSRALRAIEQSRVVLHGALATMRAVLGDMADVVLSTLRETSLFLKEASTVPVQFADLPQQVLAAAKTAILEAISVRDAFSAVPTKLEASVDAAREDYNQLVALANLLAKPDTRGGSLARNLSVLDSHVANEIFNDPAAHYAFFSAFGPADANLSPATSAAVERERSRTATKTRSDFEAIRDQLIEAQDRIADAMGLGSDDYDDVFDRTPGVAKRVPTNSDWDILHSLAAAQAQIEHLAASAADPRRQSPMAFYAAMAGRAGIDFRVPRSQKAVPLPYGWSLERIAEFYLGNADRFVEIAALNELTEPYIDEVGFDLPLVANGQDRVMSVSDASKLFVGQTVALRSSGTPTVARKIVSLEESGGAWRVEVDDLVDDFLLSDESYIHAYRRGTTNSQQLIYLPSDQDPTESDLGAKGLPGEEDRDVLARIGGLDLLLDDKLGLIITPDGDTLWAAGMTNVIQLIRIYIATKKGSLLHHPAVGREDDIGTTAAELSAVDMAQSMRDLFGNDPLFTGVDALAVSRNGPGTTVSLSVGVAGVERRLPVTFAVDR